MTYTNNEGRVMAVSEMSGAQQMAFLDNYIRFGMDQARENAKHDGNLPSEARLDLDIDNSYEMEDADEATIAVARDAYVRGWKMWVD
jgi:hypothetical protein